MIRSSQPGPPARLTPSTSSSGSVGVTVTPSTAPNQAANATQAAGVNPTSIIAQICPSGITKQPCGCTVDSASMQTLFTNSINSRLLMWPPPDSSFANCSSVGGMNATQKTGAIASAAGGITTALTAGSAPLIAASAAVPVIGIGIAAIGTLISAIGAHHAQAVAEQNNALCTAVPATNQALQAIDSQLATGQITPSQAASYYGQIAAQFLAAMKAGTSYKQCDALYAYNLALQMVLAARNQDLQTSTTGAGGAVTSGVDTLATSLGIAPVWLWGGAALAVYLLLS